MINLEQLLTEDPDQSSHSGCGSCGSGAAIAGRSRCGNGLEKIYSSTAVRMGFMRFIGEFSHSPELKFTCGARVVVQTQRGIEIGEQVSLTCNGCDKSVTREQMKAWVRSCGEDTFTFNAGRILREATAADLAEYAHIQEGARENRNFARGLAEEHKLHLKIVECECLFGGERIIFYFTAAERVDFRGLVRDLAKEYRTRIEMRQIGARDEARILADYETCGREVCCKVFLKTLKPISMRMAKLQKATLDPSQVSGRCGRLKCCLRYEHVGYEELDKRLPRIGARIHTAHGSGTVVNRQILTQLLQIRTSDDTLATVVVEDILPDGPAASPTGPAPEKSTDARARSAENAGGPAAVGTKQTPERPPGTAGGDEPAQTDPKARGGHTDSASADVKAGDDPAPRRSRRRRRRGGPGKGPATGDKPNNSQS